MFGQEYGKLYVSTSEKTFIANKKSVAGFAPSEGALIQTVFVKEIIKYPEIPALPPKAAPLPPPSSPTVEAQLARIEPPPPVPSVEPPPPVPSVEPSSHPLETVKRMTEGAAQTVPSPELAPSITMPTEVQKAEFPIWAILLAGGMALFLFKGTEGKKARR